MNILKMNILNDYLNRDLFEKTILREPLNYWDFPIAALTFCESLSFSMPCWKDGCLYRHAGKKGDTLVTYSSVDNLPRRAKTLNYMDAHVKDCAEVKKGPTEYRIGPEWLEKVPGQQFHSATVRTALRKGGRLFDWTNDFTETESAQLFREWVESAKKRHFMVFKGHYLRWLKYYFNGLDSSLRMGGVRDKNTGKLVGMFGWEYFRCHACITIAKILPVHNSTAVYTWTRGLQECIQGAPEPLKSVFCGSTADFLKQSIELTPMPSWEMKK